MAIIGLRKPPEQRVHAGYEVGRLFPPADTFVSQRLYRCIVFLRHIGCPFAEKTVRALRDLPERDARFDLFFVGHGDSGTTSVWLAQIGGMGAAKWVSDPTRALYGDCGLGYSDVSHFLGGASLRGAVRLRGEGIRNRTASGTRWQKAGAFVVDRGGVLLWKHVPATADALPDAAAIVACVDAAGR